MANTMLLVVSALVFSVTVSSVLAVTEQKPQQLGDEEQWEAWKIFYDKQYENSYEENYRKAIWRANLEKIVDYNKAGHSFTLAMNQLGDLTPIEYKYLMLGARYPGNQTGGSTFLPSSNVELPSTVDWRTEGYVTAVKNQGQCGSCWAFSSTGSLEGQHFKKTGYLVSLSEQNLVDCTRPYGNLGCRGGWMDNAFKYISANDGIDTEESYPYLAREQSYCYFQRSYVGATDTGFVDIPKGSEASLQSAVATVGPISVAIDASHVGFQFYNGGVYYDPSCSTTQLDHAVLVVGYGSYGGQDYWLVKNSWGASWGLQGYIMMARNRNNMCGIATTASYPLV